MVHGLPFHKATLSGLGGGRERLGGLEGRTRKGEDSEVGGDSERAIDSEVGTLDDLFFSWVRCI